VTPALPPYSTTQTERQRDDCRRMGRFWLAEQLRSLSSPRNTLWWACAFTSAVVATPTEFVGEQEEHPVG
jgi:hypothetical protein